MRLPITAMMAGLMLTLPTGAAAQSSCQPEFVGSGQTVVVPDIIVGRDDFTVENFNVRIRNASGINGPCQATVRVARLSISTTPNPIDFTLQARGQALTILPRETAPGLPGSDLPLAQISAGPNGFALPFRLGIPSGWGLPSGMQTEDLLILLVDNQGQIIDTLPLTIRINIPPAAEIRIVGARGEQAISSVDLGELSSDELNVSDPFGVRIWSTSPYTVRFQSQNNGELVHSNNLGRIPYELLMEQRQVSVTGGIAKQVPQGTDAFGDVFPLLLQVRPFTARAGSYSDRVEVTVSAS